MASRKLIVEIIGDASSLNKTFRQVETRTSRAASGIGRVGKAAAFTAGGLGFGALIVAAKRGFDEFNEGQRVAAQTAAVLKSTGNAAGVTATQIEDLASKISGFAGIDDEAVASVENLLLTFTDIRNVGNDKIFDQATRSAVDLSVALGQDLKSSAIQVGKALNDPIRGVTALQRVGVSFTRQQKEQIRTLVESGRTMEAQKLILRELNREFAGSAKAAGSTLTGSLNKLRNSFDNLAGAAVAGLAPALQTVADRSARWLSDSRNQAKIQHDVAVAAHLVASSVRAIIGVVETLLPLMRGIVRVFGGWENTLKLIIALSVANKLAGLVGTFSRIGTSAGVAAAETTALRGSLLRLKAIGPITLGIELLLNRKAIDKKVTSFLNKHGLGAFTGGTVHNWAEWSVAPEWAKKGLRGKGFDPFTLPGAPHRVTGGVSAAGFASAAHRRERPIVIHAHVELDGREVGKSTTKHQQTMRRRNPPQRRGRFAGGV